MSNLSDVTDEINDASNESYQPGHEEMTEENRLSVSQISSQVKQSFFIFVFNN